MALTVEDGTCKPAADAFVSRSDLIAWATIFHPENIPADEDATDAAIRRASLWLSNFPEWDGSMKCGRGLQGLAWPRTGVTDCNDDAIPDDEVPAEVVTATCFAALAELASPGVLTPTVTPGKQQKRVKADVVEVEYMTPQDQGVTGSADPAEVLRPVLTSIRDLLKCLATLPDGRKVPWPFVA